MIEHNVSVLVTADEDGYALHRVRGPQQWIHMGRHFRREEDIRLASATLSGLYSVPFNLFARAIHGPRFADKKLPVLLKSCNDDFLDRMSQLDKIAEDASAEWQILKHLTHKFDLKLRKVSDRSAAMEHLKSFHKHGRPRI